MKNDLFENKLKDKMNHKEIYDEKLLFNNLITNKISLFEYLELTKTE